ncbi:MAG: hypothetical protein PWP45_1739 [Tepidanaerobacteraceae bacterium]|nr:hypothetical protein [Tepidanaerobacteraceae bacterium]
MTKGAAAGITAGFLSAFFALTINTKLAKYSKKGAVTFGAPVVEEILKTAVAVILGGNIVLSHLGFGAVEALCDAVKKGNAKAMLAGLTAILSHTILGLVTVWTSGVLKNLPAGIFVSCILHISWNRWVSCQGK